MYIIVVKFKKEEAKNTTKKYKIIKKQKNAKKTIKYKNIKKNHPRWGNCLNNYFLEKLKFSIGSVLL